MASSGRKTDGPPSRRWRALSSGVFIGACLAALSFSVRHAGDQALVPQFWVRAPEPTARASSSAVAAGGARAVAAQDSSPVKKSGKAALSVSLRERYESPGSPVPVKERIAEVRARDRALAGAERDHGPLRVGGREAQGRPDLIVISQADLPAGVTPITRLGGRLVVRAQEVPAPTEGLGGTVVEDVASHRLGILTGTLIVRVKDWTKREELLADQGLVLRLEKPTTRFLFASLAVSGGILLESVSAKVRQLEADPRVEKAEAEVIYHQAVSQ